jgi:hypothetical protein
MTLGFSRAALGVLAAGLVLGASSAMAQPGPVRVRGTIEKVDGGTLTVKTREGETVTVKVPDNVGVAGVVKRSLTDIKANDFVGIAAMPQGEGKPQRALEVLIFPEAMRGTGEGYRPFPQVAQGTMTNATITNILGTQGAVTDSGLTLTLTYKDGKQTVVVPKGTPVVLLGQGNAAMLKPKAKVSVTGTKDASGAVTATRILVGLDGATPPI